MSLSQKPAQIRSPEALPARTLRRPPRTQRSKPPRTARKSRQRALKRPSRRIGPRTASPQIRWNLRTRARQRRTESGKATALTKKKVKPARCPQELGFTLPLRHSLQLPSSTFQLPPSSFHIPASSHSLLCRRGGDPCSLGPRCSPPFPKLTAGGRW